MPKLERGIVIMGPVEGISRYLQDPKNYQTVCKNIIEIDDVQHISHDITRFKWVYKLSGIRFEGLATLRTTNPLQQIHVQFQGGIHGDWVWQFQPLEDGVHVKLSIDYAIPVMLRKQKEYGVVLEGQEGIAQLLKNLKMALVDDRIVKS